MPSSRQNLLLFFLSLFTPALSHPLAFHCICMGGAASKPLGFVQYLVTFLVHGCWWYVCACGFAEYSVTPPLTHSICKMFLLSMVDRDVGAHGQSYCISQAVSLVPTAQLLSSISLGPSHLSASQHSSL